jgi:phenylacetate-CoA ligase
MKMIPTLETSATDCHPASVPDYTPIPQLRDLQLQRLQAVVTRAWRQIKLFRSRMDERGLAPEDIRSLEDTAKLPFTQKSDLRDTYPFGLFASPMKDVVRLHVSSGTTGKPIVVAYTKEDVDVWTSVLVRCFAGCGLHRGDIMQIAYGYGLFTGGLGAHYGAEGLGATVVPTSGGHADRQIMLMKDFGVTAMCCTPTYFLHLIDRADELGVDMKELPLRAGVFGAEPWTESMRKHIENRSSIEAFDIYGLSEIIGPGVGCECRRHQGLHIFEDHFYPEIVDPATGALLPDGSEGELVLTTLSKQAMPMIRYRTRDITTILPGKCESALLQIEGTLPNYQILLTRDQGLDQMEVRVEVTPQMFNDKIGALQELHQKLQGALDRVLGIRVRVSLVEAYSIERSEGKAKRVIDRRTS